MQDYGRNFIGPMTLKKSSGAYVDARAYSISNIQVETTQTVIEAAITDIGVDRRTLYIAAGTWNITSNLTIPANINLKMEYGAIFNIATGVTLTINGTLDAGRYTIFTWAGTGTVAYGNFIPEVYPEWYGAIPDGTTDCYTYLQKALDTHNVVHLGKGTYKFNTTLALNDNRTLYGEGPNTILYLNVQLAGIHLYNYNTLYDFTLRGPGGSVYWTGRNALVTTYYDDDDQWNSDPGSVSNRVMDVARWRGAYVVIDNLVVENWQGNGISLGPWSIFRNSVIQNCVNEGILIQADYCQIINPTIKNCGGWGIDLNCSYTTVQGGYIYNCGDNHAGAIYNWVDDCGGICINSSTHVNGVTSNKIIGTTINTSDFVGILVIIPTNTEYTLTDIVLSDLTVKNVCIHTADNNAGGIDIVDNSVSGKKLKDIQISNCTVDTTTNGHGISLLGACNVNINNYNIKNPHNMGIYVYKGTFSWENINIGRGVINNWDQYGMYCYSGTGLSIDGYNIKGTVGNTNQTGILIHSVTEFNVSSGIINLNITGGYGIYITSAAGNGCVSGNNISNCLCGVYYDATGNYVNIVGNNLSNSITTPITRLGTKTAVVQANNLGVTIPTFTNNAHALSEGWPVGEVYRIISTDTLAIVH